MKMAVQTLEKLSKVLKINSVYLLELNASVVKIYLLRFENINHSNECPHLQNVQFIPFPQQTPRNFPC